MPLPLAPTGPAGAATRRKLHVLKLELVELAKEGNFIEAIKEATAGGAGMELELVCIPLVFGAATLELCFSVSGDLLGLLEQELPIRSDVLALADLPTPVCAETAAAALAAVEARGAEDLKNYFDSGFKMGVQACVVPTLKVKWLFTLAHKLKILDRGFDLFDFDLKLCVAEGDLEWKTWQARRQWWAGARRTGSRGMLPADPPRQHALAACLPCRTCWRPLFQAAWSTALAAWTRPFRKGCCQSWRATSS